MFRINKHLVPVKILLFLVYGGFACLWPFLSVHMKRLGLTIEETAIINLVTSFTSLLGPPLACTLITKTKRSKLILILSIILSALAFSALLFVPPTLRHKPRDPHIIFKCDIDGSQVQVERCDHACYIPKRSPEPSLLNLRHCRYMCNEQFGTKGPGSSVPPKPYICVDHYNYTDCYVYNTSGYANDIGLYVPYIEFNESTDICSYPLLMPTSNGTLEPQVQCRISSPGCSVTCEGVLPRDNTKVIDLHQCQKVDGRPWLTLGAYFVLRIIAEFFLYSSLALLEATVKGNVLEFQGFYSQQFLWGLLAAALLSPLVGLVIDHLAGSVEYLDYAPAFASFDLVLLIAVVLLAFLPLTVHNCTNKLSSYVGRVVRNAEVSTLFVMMFFLGNVFGFMETFYYWFLDDKGASAYFLGLTLTVGIFPSIPILLFGDRIVTKCGHPNLLIAAFFAASFRLLGCSLLNDFYHFLPFEVFKVLSDYLMWAAAMTYCEKLGPKLLAYTISGTAAVMHTNLGRGIGVLLGGTLMKYFGAELAFRCTAVYSGCIGLIYMTVYHFFLKSRREPIYIETSLNGHYTPMETYGNGDNQVHKPMLQEKNRY